jgi:glycosyltransferase involved in cell wall biosynthesis
MYQLDKERKYKIVYCTPALYSAGGVERVVSVKANFLAEVYGYDVTVIVTEGQGRECFFHLSNKVHIINLQLGFENLWRASFIKKIFFYLKKQRQYKKLLTIQLMRLQPDFTITTLRREINFIVNIPDGSIKIGELHVNRANYRNFSDRDSNVIKQWFAHVWMNSLIQHLRQLDKMVVLTDSAMNDWPELNHIVKIPDPLPFHIKAKSELSSKRIVSIGRYDYDKGNDLLLQIWEKIEKQMPEWTLDIYGNGNREPYESQMKQLCIDTSRCHLHGPITDVLKEYNTSSIFVLPSRYEGFGLVLIEAMACGVPVVSFDCENGPRSIITDSVDGFLIQPFDIDAFAEKVILLMNDDELRKEIGENAQKSAFQYDIERVGLQWEQLFNELMVNG